MFPAFAAIGAAFNIAGGILQSNQIQRATEERLRQMNRKNQADLSSVAAHVGAAGVEMSSATVQTYLERMNEEFRRRAQSVIDTGDAASLNSWMSGVSSAMGGFASGVYKAGQVADALGPPSPLSEPFLDGGRGVQVKQPEFDWIR